MKITVEVMPEMDAIIDNMAEKLGDEEDDPPGSSLAQDRLGCRG